MVPPPITASSSSSALDVLPSRLRRTTGDPKLPAGLLRTRPAQLLKAIKEEQGCPPGKEVHEVDEMLVFYSETELQACVHGPLLASQLDRVDAIPFTYEQLAVLKIKLDKTYPQGYPEDVVQRLGSLFLMVTPDDINKWDVKSSETLKALLRVSRGQSGRAQVAALITRYAAGGAQINEGTLAMVATLSPASLCLFSPEQLRLLQPHILWEVESGALEDCPLLQMKVLYSKAYVAFQNITGPSYFGRIRPYLGGVTTEHLRSLSRRNISMDITTFKELRKESVQPLTVAEVKALLGPHVVDLKAEERNSPVWDWIVGQRQEDLDSLGLGLQGGIPNGYLLVALGAQGGRG
ncbi:PREDICTED: mesothelin [Chrysochloris asiatica]|uniref:Mesothelin n=1 Tax=Chrysochloris asiatica TaxID=185453 RepID=A0A9B0U7A3_CHRAS|nr:PREDICTED: mesothelin [Chrysochloris asiatica]